MKTRILVVEDEAILARELADQLADLGHEVVGVTPSADDAARLAADLAPDLVFMDIRLRGSIDGVDAAAAIRAAFGPPVVFLTAHSDTATLDRAKRAEPYGYLHKPWEERDVRTVVEMAVHKHRADAAVRTSEERHRTTLRSIGDGVIAVDPDGRVTLLNPAAERMTGWTETEATGRPIGEVLNFAAGVPAVPLPNPVDTALRTGAVAGLPPDAVLRARDGRVVPVDDLAAPILGARGAGGAVVAFRDVTAQREAEAAVRGAQKLESLGVLAGGIAHDFNNLLTPILGYADLLRLGTLPAAETQGMLAAIEAAARTAARLTYQLLAYAGKGRVEVGPVDLTALAREMAPLLAVGASPAVAVRYDLAAPLPAVEADGAQMRQLVMNLVTNAADAVGAGPGWVAVRTREVTAAAADLASPFFTPAPPPGRYVVLEVADSGCGMAEDTVAKIFDPFFTTKATGRGLGLAAVLGIVRGHNGTLRVTTAPGKGTTFRLLFPASARPAPVRADVPPATGRAAGTVLVVDDDPSVRDLARRALEAAGLATLAAASGQEALEVFDRNRGKVDVVLLDLMMPPPDGAAVAAELARVAPGVRVVIMSGYGPEEVTARLAGTPLRGVVQKPFRPAGLVQLIRDVLAAPAS